MGDLMDTDYYYTVVVPDDNHRASIRKILDGGIPVDRETGRFSTWVEAYEYLKNHHRREIAFWEDFCRIRREEITVLTIAVEGYEKTLIPAYHKFLREVESLEEPSPESAT